MVHFRNSFLIYCVCSSFVDVKWISLSVFGFFNWTKSKKNNVVQFGEKTLGCKSSEIRCVLECAPLKSTTNLKAISTHSRINSKWSVILLESIENSQQISTFFIYIHSHRIRKKPNKIPCLRLFHLFQVFVFNLYPSLLIGPFLPSSNDVWHCLVLFSSIYFPNIVVVARCSLFWLFTLACRVVFFSSTIFVCTRFNLIPIFRRCVLMALFKAQ